MSEHQAFKQGSISIDAQNIMPVIKRWLYSDKDIFIRELVSNGVDAISKYRMMGKGGDEDLRVTVTVDKEAGIISFTDNGIGMTAEEVDRYINQVAFSSAEEFLKNYTAGDQSGIIGHFGLGFYSAFMAASKVTIDTLSWQENASPVMWESEDGMAYSMSKTMTNAITQHFAYAFERAGSRVKINSAAPGHCATPFNNFRGWRSAAEGAQIAVALSLIDETGPNGGFFRQEGKAPW